MSAEQLSPKCSPVTEIVNVHKHDLSLAFGRIVSRWLVVPREIQTARLIHSVSHIYLYIFLSVRYCISMFSVCVCVYRRVHVHSKSNTTQLWSTTT